MEFRLLYEGALPSSNGGDSENKQKTKQNIRRYFHLQLKELWTALPYLRTGKSSGPELDAYVETSIPIRVEKENSLFGFRFKPLVTEDLHLNCAIELLFLRRGDPGGVLNRGDIDNRVKTLIDCLQKPDSNQG